MTRAELNTLSTKAHAKGGAVMHLMGSAEDNTRETVGADEVAVTVSSLRESLSECNDKGAVAWFAAHGVKI